MSDCEKIDNLRASVTTISRNLMELGETEAVKTVRVRFKDPINGYMGATREKVAKAIKTLDGLWDSYLLLARVVEEASDLAGKNGLFHNTEEEVRELLEGDSIELPAEHIPITSRGLLSTASKVERVTPDVLLQAMEQQFCEARDCVNEISGAIAQAKPRLAAIRQQAVTLANWAKTLGAASRLPDDLEKVLASLDSDPLCCAAEIDRLESELGKERLLLQSIEEEHTATRQSIEHARSIVSELRELSSRSAAAIEEAKEKIRQPEGLVLPISEEAIASLSAWLDSLEGNAATGHYGAVKVGMGKWQTEGEARLMAEREGYTRNRAALDERAELKGSFKALCVKAEALKAKGVPLGDTLLGLALEAEQTLNTIPFDLKMGRRAVEAYESALNTQYNLHRQTNR
ncbi:MAG TPA: hypothetical protein VI298_15645 [Geobacteraceae bacterium]